MSRRRKKQKDDEEEEEQRIVSSAASGYNPVSIAGSGYPYPALPYGAPLAASAVDIDLPPATTLDDRPSYWAY